MKKRILWPGCVLVVIFGLVGFPRVVSASDWTYPAEQAWLIRDGRPVAGAKVPADLAGIPFILRRSHLYLLPNAVVMPSANMAGAFSVRPGCFRESGSELTFYSLQEGLEKSSFFFRNVTDEKIQLVVDGMFEFDLERIPLNAEAEEKLLLARASFNRHAGVDDGGTGEQVVKGCRIAALKQKHPSADKDLQVTYPALKVSKTFRAHAPDPTTLIEMDSARSLSYERHTGADAMVRGCQVKMRQREARFSGKVLYIMQGISGMSDDGKTICSRTERIWTIDEAVVSVLLPVEPGFTPDFELRDIDRRREPGEYFFEIKAEGFRMEKKTSERVFYILRLGNLDKESPTLELLETNNKCFRCR